MSHSLAQSWTHLPPPQRTRYLFTGYLCSRGQRAFTRFSSHREEAGRNRTCAHDSNSRPRRAKCHRTLQGVQAPARPHQQTCLGRGTQLHGEVSVGNLNHRWALTLEALSRSFQPHWHSPGSTARKELFHVQRNPSSSPVLGPCGRLSPLPAMVHRFCPLCSLGLLLLRMLSFQCLLLTPRKPFPS